MDRTAEEGIHLCVIENSPSKPIEAWANINAIDDVIKTLVTMNNKVSVAVLRGNAGAGGAMLAAACDFSVAHMGVLLTPSYKAMSLYGSEYWTYFLPRRVGYKKAQQLVQETTPISAQEAESIGLLDKVFLMNKEDMMMALPEYLHELQLNGKIDDVIRTKRTKRDSNWRWLINQHRAFELTQMRQNFRSTEFLTAMHNFVYHITVNAERI